MAAGYWIGRPLAISKADGNGAGCGAGPFLGVLPGPCRPAGECAGALACEAPGQVRGVTSRDRISPQPQGQRPGWPA